MSTPTLNPKERLALLRFEVICHIKTLRQDGQPLALCLRDAASRRWPGGEGKCYSFRTIETWWYDYTSRGYQGLVGKSARADAGQSRSINEELGLCATSGARPKLGRLATAYSSDSLPTWV